MIEQAPLFTKGKLNELEECMCNLLNQTAQDLWDIGMVIFTTGIAGADDWEAARACLSHALAALQTPHFERVIDTEAPRKLL